MNALATNRNLYRSTLADGVPQTARPSVRPESGPSSTSAASFTSASACNRTALEGN